MTAMDTKATVNMEAIILATEFGGGGAVTTVGESGELGVDDDCWMLVMAIF